MSVPCLLSQLNLDNALMRFEFLEALIRVAVAKVRYDGSSSSRPGALTALYSCLAGVTVDSIDI
jgi:hypothetical protein